MPEPHAPPVTAPPRAPRAAARRRHALLALGLLAALLVAYLAGNGGAPLWDRDEPRYAVAAREMLDAGNWVVPTFLGDDRLKKPPLVYWAQASAMAAFGSTAFAARLPSALAMTATLALLLLALPRVVGRRRAFWTAVVLGTALLPIWCAKAATVDALLLVPTVGALLLLYAALRGRFGGRAAVALGACLGLAVLAKGPVAPFYLAATLAAFGALTLATRERRFARLVTVDAERLGARVAALGAVALIVALGIALPWALALERARPGALAKMVADEVVARGVTAQEGHAGPPGFYLLTVFVTWLPWSLLLPAALWQGWKRRGSPFARFALAAVIGPWVCLEIYTTKLPHYGLPSYPFLAYLTADVILRARRRVIADLADRPFVIAAGFWAGALVLAGLALLLVPLVVRGEPARSWWPLLAMTFGVGGWAVYVFDKWRQRRPLVAAGAMAAGLPVVFAVAYAAYLPSTRAFTLAPRVAGLLPAGSGARLVGYKEPSVAFYADSSVREERDAQFLDQLDEARWPTWVVMTAEARAAQKLGPRVGYVEAGRARGLNLADGAGATEVVVLRRKALSR